MADVTVYALAGIPVEVIAGSAPVDQSAEVAALTQQVADLTASNEAKQAKLDQLEAKAKARVAADAASVDGAEELAIING
jgi:hypothetical protein